MAIATAVEKNGRIVWFDAGGRQLGSVFAEGLHGYTASSVSVRKGNRIITYDEKGRQTGSVFV